MRLCVCEKVHFVAVLDNSCNFLRSVFSDVENSIKYESCIDSHPPLVSDSRSEIYCLCPLRRLHNASCFFKGVDL